MNTHYTLDLEFINRIGSRLEGFVSKGSHIWNFRCPMCGDSHKNKFKKRGYILENKDQKFLFYCHNCNTSLGIKKFLEQVDYGLYEEYITRLITEAKELALLSKKQKEEDLAIAVQSFKSYLTSNEDIVIPITSLSKTHKAIAYLNNRCVPETQFHRIKWVTDFTTLAHKAFGDKYQNRTFPNEGLLFILKDPVTKEPTGMQMRSIDPDIPKHKRFNTLKLQDANISFGEFDQEPQYVIEGTIDNLFLPNCISTLNSHLSGYDYPGAIYINDNEPRNKEVAKEVHRCVLKGYATCMLPEEYNGMDINDLYIKLGCNQDKLITLIKKYTHKGLEARMKFASWNKS